MGGFSVVIDERTARSHVDLPCPAFVEIVKRTDPRQHLAARCRQRAMRPKCSALRNGTVALAAPVLLQIQISVNGSQKCATIPVLRRQRRRNAAPKSGSAPHLRHWRRLGLQRCAFETTPSSTIRSSTRSRAACAARTDDGQPPFRRPRQRHQGMKLLSDSRLGSLPGIGRSRRRARPRGCRRMATPMRSRIGLRQLPLDLSAARTICLSLA